MMTDHATRDDELVEQCLRGDRASLDALVRRHARPVYRLAYRMVGNAQEAEDCAQEVFVRVWRNLRRFDTRKQFQPWVFQITRNAAIDVLRKRRAAPVEAFSSTPDDASPIERLPDPAPLPSELLQRADTARVVRIALERLTSNYRLVLVLHYRKQLTFREIAETLGESLNTVKSRHRRALLLLQRMLVEAPDGAVFRMEEKAM